MTPVELAKVAAARARSTLAPAADVFAADARITAAYVVARPAGAQPDVALVIIAPDIYALPCAQDELVAIAQAIGAAFVEALTPPYYFYCLGAPLEEHAADLPPGYVWEHIYTAPPPAPPAPQSRPHLRLVVDNT